METLQSSNHKINIGHANISLYIKREDQLHPFISGNKYRKLKYNLIQAKKENKTALLTFGGAFSNHILAVAAAGNEFGFKTVGIIRGEELQEKINENPTLQKAKDFGMVFEFVSRETYREKNSPAFMEKLKAKFDDFYLIPEGGTNDFAIKGCEEILTREDEKFNYICCSVGTGGTISGLINCSKSGQQVLGFPALKGAFLKEDICRFAAKSNWDLITSYHFGGYGKVSEELIRFINEFYQQHKIILDPIYTGKMVFGVIDLINKNYFPENSKILMIHTGGLQGIAGMNKVLKQKKQLEINVND
ncbi:MAG: pyridoxal-phosphate dependent enzyme [Flavobacterium sp.]